MAKKYTSKFTGQEIDDILTDSQEHINTIKNNSFKSLSLNSLDTAKFNQTYLLSEYASDSDTYTDLDLFYENYDILKGLYNSGFTILVHSSNGGGVPLELHAGEYIFRKTDCEVQRDFDGNNPHITHITYQTELGEYSSRNVSLTLLLTKSEDSIYVEPRFCVSPKDTEVVYLSGDQTITGDKTFTGSIKLSSDNTAVRLFNSDNSLRITDAQIMGETIIKTGFPIIETKSPLGNAEYDLRDFATTQYVDEEILNATTSANASGAVPFNGQISGDLAVLQEGETKYCSSGFLGAGNNYVEFQFNQNAKRTVTIRSIIVNATTADGEPYTSTTDLASDSFNPTTANESVTITDNNGKSVTWIISAVEENGLTVKAARETSADKENAIKFGTTSVKMTNLTFKSNSFAGLTVNSIVIRALGSSSSNAKITAKAGDESLGSEQTLAPNTFNDFSFATDTGVALPEGELTEYEDVFVKMQEGSILTITPTEGTLYYNTEDNNLYQYNEDGVYVISPGMVLGTEANQAYPGSYGQTNYKNIQDLQAKTKVILTREQLEVPFNTLWLDNQLLYVSKTPADDPLTNHDCYEGTVRCHYTADGEFGPTFYLSFDGTYEGKSCHCNYACLATEVTNDGPDYFWEITENDSLDYLLTCLYEKGLLHFYIETIGDNLLSLKMHQFEDLGYANKELYINTTKYKGIGTLSASYNSFCGSVDGVPGYCKNVNIYDIDETIESEATEVEYYLDTIVSSDKWIVAGASSEPKTEVYVHKLTSEMFKDGEGNSYTMLVWTGTDYEIYDSQVLYVLLRCCLKAEIYMDTSCRTLVAQNDYTFSFDTTSLEIDPMSYTAVEDTVYTLSEYCEEQINNNIN